MLATPINGSVSPFARLHPDSENLSTLPDPRTSNSSVDVSRSNSTHHPDLSAEVATLSNKLISAINHQTNLDDSLSTTRHELESSRERIRQLESALQEYRDMVASGLLVRKIDIEDKTLKLMANLADEKKQRGVVEKDKKGIEQELETLTTALFEEANQMVAAARKERETVERRNEQLRAQLHDTETLLISHQEQLAELKAVMLEMSSDRGDSDPVISASNAPSTPAFKTYESLSKNFESLHLLPPSAENVEILPAPPTSYNYLLHPVLRTDLQAFDDFRSLLQISRKSAPSSRVTSGSYSGLNVADLGHLATHEKTHKAGRQASNGSTSSISTPVTHHSSPDSPSTPVSTSSYTSAKDLPPSVVSLKETRFYKRILAEDIEPALRLDTAPGISWLARRNVITSMCEGSLVVEPMPPSVGLYLFSCSLCGESRPGDENARSHRFRISETESAQRYPLCPYCLNRVRASCDFLSFLRMVKDGHWRTDGAEAEHAAWEESVRLRERLFWAKIGGGVIPAFVRARESPRSSVEEGDTHPSSAQLDKGLPSGDELASSCLRGDPFQLETRPASNDNKLDAGHDYRQDIETPPGRPRRAATVESETPGLINRDRTFTKQFQNRLRIFQGFS